MTLGVLMLLTGLPEQAAALMDMATRPADLGIEPPSDGPAGEDPGDGGAR